MKLTVGNKISYAGQGPCLVGSVVKRVIDGKPTEFYRLFVLTYGGGELLIPVDKPQSRGIRKLLEKSEIPKLLGRLNKVSASDEKWQQRTRENSLLFNSGSAYDLAEIVGSMSALRETKRFQPSDRQTLERAKDLLACEISEVTGETKSTAEEKIDKVLAERKANRKACKEIGADWPEMERHGRVF